MNMRTLLAALVGSLTCACLNATRAETIDAERVAVASSDSSERVFFHADVVPLLTRLGCNGGGCHGKASGQNGFRLSLLGFEPDVDYHAMVTEARGRRIFPAAPDRSLLLLKATAQLPHGGGKRLEEASEDYRILRDWIAQGATAAAPSDPRVRSIEFTTPEFPSDPPQVIPLAVRAHFDGRDPRDVTRQAVYQSNEPEIATVDARGVVRLSGRPGVFVVSARYGEAMQNWSAVVPYVTDAAEVARVQHELDCVEEQLQASTGQRSAVDRSLLRQWRKLRVVPSGLADDGVFLRRVSIDVCGTLPTSEELQAFITDSDPHKHRKLVDRLLERPEYASYFAVKWADILQNRGAGYSTSQQRAGTTLFAGWIRDSFAENKPYDQFVRELLTATGSQRENPPTVWYRSLRKPPEFVESVSQAFLGFRMQCAQCHHHPFEKWSQNDYYSFAAFFSQVGRRPTATKVSDTIFHRRGTASAVNKKTKQAVKPAALITGPMEIPPDDDPRIALAEWMSNRANPFFARTLVNRYWKHFFNRGIVEPEDDMRETNPPSNPELLTALAERFIESGYDLKALIRDMTRSQTYQLSAVPNNYNKADRQNYSRYYAKRLPAEVLFDSLNEVTRTSGNFGGLPVGTRAISLPDNSFNAGSYFLTVFGRPDSSSACECERTQEASLAQALHLLNAKDIQEKLASANGAAAKLAADPRPEEEKIREIYLTAYSRLPDDSELGLAKAHISKARNGTDGKPMDPVAAKRQGYEDIVWAILNTKEFLFNH